MPQGKQILNKSHKTLLNIVFKGGQQVQTPCILSKGEVKEIFNRVIESDSKFFRIDTGQTKEQIEAQYFAKDTDILIAVDDIIIFTITEVEYSSILNPASSIGIM